MYIFRYNYDITILLQEIIMNNTKSEKSNVSYEDGFFMGKNDIKIYYKSYEVDDSKSVIVISHGFCESSEKYREFIKT